GWVAAASNRRQADDAPAGKLTFAGGRYRKIIPPATYAAGGRYGGHCAPRRAAPRDAARPDCRHGAARCLARGEHSSRGRSAARVALRTRRAERDAGRRGGGTVLEHSAFSARADEGPAPVAG